MRILAVTSMRNEAPYLLEWVAHHSAAGVTDFLIFSNDCDDGTDRLLDQLHAAGIVTHVPHHKQGRKSVQWQALKSAWHHPLRKQADWILVSDVDEFVNIHVGRHRFADLIGALPEGSDAVVLPWRLFGQNDVFDIKDAPVTEQFTRAIVPDSAYPVAASLFKTLFRARGPFRQLGVHRPKQKPFERTGLPTYVDGSGIPLPRLFAESEKRISLYGYASGRALVEMNHYALRSAAAFVVKRDRGLPNRAHKKIDLSYWVDRNFNCVEDRSIGAMRPATMATLASLLKLERVAELHDAALRWHRAKFAELVQDPETHALLSQVLTAGSSTVLPRQLQRQLVRWYQDIHNNTA